MSGHSDTGNAMSAGPGDEILEMQIADALRPWFEDDADDAAREVRQILAPVIARRVQESVPASCGRALQVLERWSTPDGTLRVEADEREEFDGEILAALREAGV